MTQRPITEDDLHAYVDQALSPERRADVAAYLGNHPDVAKRIAAFGDQRAALRAALAPVAEEPLPPELNLARMIEGRQRRSSRPRWAVAAALLLCLGAAIGWGAHGTLQTQTGGLTALAQEATDSYNVYAPDHVRPVELRAADSNELVQWVSNRLHRPVKVPDLATAGYRLMGGRLIATSHGPAAMLMYDDDHGSRIVVVTRPMNGTNENAAMTAQSRGNLTGFAWADGGNGYSLVGQLPSETLKPIANEVRRQAGEI